MPSLPKNLTLKYFAHNLFIVIGLVLVWRGVWYVIDWIDMLFFRNNHTWTAVIGIALGLLILYVPDHDLKEIGKL